MCGVAGIYAFNHAAPPVSRDELRAIRDQMAARGPDGHGEWFSSDGRVALGHRRLSIVDLSERAAQPMASADHQLIVSFNGEIYNYPALKKELEAKGHIFRTTSDTEVLLHLYAEKGDAMLQDLRGMFAFALWDQRKQALLLARDPYGIKPLYYADDGRTLRLASQVKALLTSPHVSRESDSAGLAGFYLLGSVPEPYTLYQQIRSVPAGSSLWVDRQGAHAPKSYFSVAQVWHEAENSSSMPAHAIQASVRAALLDSVRHHMMADVPVGAFLSAGIDSGALVGLMKDAGQRDIKTVTLGFDEFWNTAQDEAPLAARVARHYGVHHANRVVSEIEFQEDLPGILVAMDQPSIDGINTWFVSKAAAEIGLKVAVSGVGGDELLGGYPSFRDIPHWVRMMWLPGHIPGMGALLEQVQAAFPLLRGVHPKAAGMVRYGGTYAGAYLLRRGLFLPRELPELMGADAAGEGLRRLQPVQHIVASLTSPLARKGPQTAYGKVATLESALYLRNQLLRDTDWASMAHSLEVRTPLVDATLLRQLAVPLLSSGQTNNKQLLAASPSVPLPGDVASRAKSGFATPLSGWQQRGDRTQAWRDIPSLAEPNCPWARRWSYAVMNRAIG